MKIAGVILAGGLARRMGGGDKALLQVGGRSLLAQVIERLLCEREIAAPRDDHRSNELERTPRLRVRVLP